MGLVLLHWTYHLTIQAFLIIRSFYNWFMGYKKWLFDRKLNLIMNPDHDFTFSKADFQAELYPGYLKNKNLAEICLSDLKEHAAKKT